jgi:hypothetical protein
MTGIGINGLSGGGAAGLSSLGADPRSRATLSLLNTQADAASSDTVNLSDGALWGAAAASVREGLNQLNKSIDAGENMEGLLRDLQSAAKTYGDDPSSGREAIDQILAKLQSAAGDAEAQGARMVRGQSISVTAEPGAAPITIPGLDLQVRNAPSSGDLIQVPASGDIDAAALQSQAKASLDNLRAQLSRLGDARNALDQHSSLLSAASGSATSGVQTDLDAEGARLLALQVRQGLSQSNATSIVNVEPGAVLSLFRSA